MFRLNASLPVYLHREPIDFRKNINGLAALRASCAGLHTGRPSSRLSSFLPKQPRGSYQLSSALRLSFLMPETPLGANQLNLFNF